MTFQLDETHDPNRQSWVESARGNVDFPIQNLPFGIFSPDKGTPRVGVAIGDHILDLKAMLEARLFQGLHSQIAPAVVAPTLNSLMAMDSASRMSLRKRVSALLNADSEEGKQMRQLANPKNALLHKSSDCVVHLPAAIGNYTDFYAGIHHATNAGRRRGREIPLFPNYKYMPVAYHGRASSVRAAGALIKRPSGQRMLANESEPSFGATRQLDFELELGVWIGPGNALGEPIPIAQAINHITGLCLLNDCSARDIQGWEAQPLGPFLAKNFSTIVSPWVITLEALAPFRVPQPVRPTGDPRPLPHLWDDSDQQAGAFDIDLEVSLLTEEMRKKGMQPQRISLSNTLHLYWTVAQMVTHHSSGGCNLMPGDLFGSGTISAPTREGYGSIRELTEHGKIELPSGEIREFLQDGDEVIFRAQARREGFVSIGFGENRSRIV